MESANIAGKRANVKLRGREDFGVLGLGDGGGAEYANDDDAAIWDSSSDRLRIESPFTGAGTGVHGAYERKSDLEQEAIAAVAHGACGP